METPRRRNFTKTQAEISGFLARECRLENGHLTCAHCGGELRRVRAFLSLHDQQFGDACIGPGRAWRMEIPYCPACEDPPSRYGCIHMSESDLNLPDVIEASRPFGAIQTRRTDL